MTESNKSKTKSSDLDFWRSQHRAQDEADGTPKSLQRVWEEGVFNRLGEEMGQRMDELIWPMIPERVKNTVAVSTGTIAPFWLAYQKLTERYKQHKNTRFTRDLEEHWLASTVESAALALWFDEMAMKKIRIDAEHETEFIGDDPDAKTRALRIVFIRQLSERLGLDFKHGIASISKQLESLWRKQLRHTHSVALILDEDSRIDIEKESIEKSCSIEDVLSQRLDRYENAEAKKAGLSNRGNAERETALTAIALVSHYSKKVLNGALV
jgi:hypothetical protein